MSVDPARIIQPAAMQTSTPNGQVAPPSDVQGGVGAPGLYAPAINPQPGIVPDGNASVAPATPSIDYQAALEAERQARLRIEGETNQYRQMFGEIQRAAAETQQNQQINERIQMITSTANSLPASEAETYMKNQINAILGDVRLSSNQQIQQIKAENDAMMRVVAAPTYADHLAQQLQLSPEAKEELVALGDPDLMYKMAPQIKQRYDRFNTQLAQYQQGQTQIARTQEVAALSQAGLGAFGGQTAGGSYQLEVSDDPDEAALQILHHLRERDRGGANIR
jgi:hypothetical protein